MIDQALLDRVQKQAWFHKYPRGWPFLLFLIASITTAVSVMAIERADKQTRAVRIIPMSKNCKKGEVTYVWNKKGKKGDPGATGSTGAQGVTGATGAAGGALETSGISSSATTGGEFEMGLGEQSSSSREMTSGSFPLSSSSSASEDSTGS